jgi:hypothetical protein
MEGTMLSMISVGALLLVPLSSQAAQKPDVCIGSAEFVGEESHTRETQLACNVSVSTREWGGRFSTPRQGEISVTVCETRDDVAIKAYSLSYINADGAAKFRFPASLRMNQTSEGIKMSPDPNVWAGDEDWLESDGGFGWLSVRINRVTGSLSYTEVVNSRVTRFARLEFDYAERETKVEGSCVKMDPKNRKF